jgi:hypothetical protein
VNTATDILRTASAVVTSSTIEIGGKTFAVRNVSAVHVQRPRRPSIALLVAILGALTIATTDGGMRNVFAWCTTAAAAAWIWQQSRMRHLYLTTAGKATLVMKSTDTAAVEALRAAIAQAISAN